MQTPETQPQPEVQPVAPAAGGATTRERRFWRPRNFLVLGASAAALAVACTSVGVTLGVGVPLALTAASSVAGTGSGSSSSLLDTRGSGSGTTTSPHGTFGYGYGGGQAGSGSGSSGSGRSGSGSTGSGAGTATEAATDATADQAVGVVLINTELKYESAAAAGTGIILTSDGKILTNNHVVEGSTSISVTIASTGKTYTATVVGTDATNDVAVLQLKGASGLTPASLDTSESLAVGDAITGVGNAGGTGTLSAAAGTVTGLEQSVTTQAEGSAAGETLDGMIQVEADIKSGDSGGPLYDADGEVVGIDTAASSGSATVTGFAIPINDALSIAKQIDSGVATSTVTIGLPAFLGIEVASATTGTSTLPGSGNSGSSGTSGSAGTVAGATVAGVIAGTPAETAGLAAGDVITAVDGTTVASGTALTSTLKTYAVGDTVTLTYTDASGAAHTTTATLIAGPAA